MTTAFLTVKKLAHNYQCDFCMKALPAGISIVVVFVRIHAPKGRGVGQFKASVCNAIINCGIEGKGAFYLNANRIEKGSSYVRFK